MIGDITKWSKISAESFKSMQFDSGMLVKNFDASEVTEPSEDDILCTTTGNITVNCTPTMVDLGDDVNNLHVQAKELQYIQRWTATMGFTALEMSPEVLKMVLGAADVDSESGAITPRMELKEEDFTQNLALVMRLIGGGLAVAVIDNALSTGGLSITTQKEGKGNLAVTMTAFASLTKQDVPMKFYVIDEA